MKTEGKIETDNQGLNFGGRAALSTSNKKRIKELKTLKVSPSYRVSGETCVTAQGVTRYERRLRSTGNLRAECSARKHSLVFHKERRGEETISVSD